MKILKQWREAKCCLDEFLKPGDEIDSEMYWYMMEVLPPIYHNYGIFQVSEAYDHTPEGFATYGTYQAINDLDESGEVVEKYFYLGNMTKAKASKYSKTAF